MGGFEIIDRISDPGSAGKPNDDWLAVTKSVAIVCDGATGLGEERVVDTGESDAQFVARLGCEMFADAGATKPVRDVVDLICHDVRKAMVTRSSDRDLPPRWAWPASAFIAARHQGDMIEISGLGDCSALIQFSDGPIQRVSAIPFNNQEASAAALDLKGRGEAEDALTVDSVVQSLRDKRSLLNTVESNVWTLGPVPEAADHVLSMALPVDEVEMVLLVSDGFSALYEEYGLLGESEIMPAISRDGLPELVTKLRHLERVQDPRQEQFPRYKQSDDATAILVKIM